MASVTDVEMRMSLLQTKGDISSSYLREGFCEFKNFVATKSYMIISLNLSKAQLKNELKQT